MEYSTLPLYFNESVINYGHACDSSVTKLFKLLDATVRRLDINYMAHLLLYSITVCSCHYCFMYYLVFYNWRIPEPVKLISIWMTITAIAILLASWLNHFISNSGILAC